MGFVATMFRRPFGLLAIAAIPFLLMTGESPVRSENQSAAEINYDIRSDPSETARSTIALAAERRGESSVSIARRRKLSENAEQELLARDPHLVIERNAATGNAELIATKLSRLPSSVTGRAAGNRPDTLRRFLNANRSLFGLDENDVQGLKLTADYLNPAGNLAFVHLEQSIDGVPVFGGEVKAGFTADGSLLRVVNNLASFVGDRLYGDFGSSSFAIEAAARFAPNARALAVEPFIFPLADGVAVPSWRVYFESAERSYYVLVEAESGTLLWRKDLTSHQTQTATYEVYGNLTSIVKTADSPSPFTPGCQAPTNCPQPAATSRTQFTLIGNEAPYTFNNLGWITDGETRTIGNSTEVGIDRDGLNGIDPNGWAFGGPQRNFVFAYNPAPGLPVPGEEPVPTTQTYPPSAFQQGSVTQAFYVANRFHDETYLLGFTEQARNFQSSNFGRGGLENDSIIVEVQDSSGTNGANFATPADGARPRGQMFVWTNPTPDRDGALDAQVLIHELTHGLSNRLHGNATGLSSNMARGMGEGWSDFYALSLLSEPLDAECGTSTVAGYITYLIFPLFDANYYNGIRRFPTARKQCVGPNGLPHNPVTFRYLNADCNTLIGSTTSNPPPSSAFPRGPIGTTVCDQTHNMGEVWASALWEVRGELIGAHGPAEGNRRALQYVTDGMKLSPVNPTFLQARDAIIAAAGATAASDGIHVRRGFAIRGLGASARIINPGSGSNDTVVLEAFDIFENARIAPGFAVSDSPGNNNGYPEQGERVVVTVPIINNSGATITGINVFSPTLGSSAFYGDIAAGQTVIRNLSATIPSNAPCGGSFEIAFSITSSVGQSSETRSIVTGAIAESRTFTGTTPITINDSGPATPYPTSLNVTGLASGNTRITLELNELTHTYPGDVDLLLVGPGGRTLIPMSDVGGGTDVSLVTLSLSDFASGQMPSTALAGGNFKPTSFLPTDTFGAPAPAGPFLEPAPTGTSSFESAFGSTAANLNGSWSLYVADDASGDTGALAGWKLRFDTYVCSACACLTGVRSDFDADGRSDLAVFRPTDGVWYQERTVEGFSAVNWGIAGDRIAPGDYDGDGRTDPAVFRPNADPALPDFYVLNSANSTVSGVSFGVQGDVPVIADYDGDSRDDFAVHRPSNHTFYVLRSGGGGPMIFSNISFGTPVAGDFDGDGRADFVTYSIDGWFISQSNINYASVNFVRFGSLNDNPVPGDYDGDGKDDLAVFRRSDQTWYVRRSTGGTTFFRFGLSTDTPVPADYDGDGKLDFAVYRDGTWYIERSSGGTLIRQFGLAGDAPVPAGYVP